MKPRWWAERLKPCDPIETLDHGCAQAISKEHPDRALPTIDHAQDRPEPSVLIESLPGKPGVEVLVRLELGKQIGLRIELGKGNVELGTACLPMLLAALVLLLG